VKSHLILCLGLALAAASAGTPAAAATVGRSQINSGGDSIGVSFHNIYATSPNPLGNTLNTIANSFTTTLTSGPTTTTVETYCIDLYHYTSSDFVAVTPYAASSFAANMSSNYQNSQNTLNTPNTTYFQEGLGRAAWLVNTYGAASNLNRAGLQIAIWKSIYEESGNVAASGAVLNAGSIRFSNVDSAVKTAAEGYLHASISAAGGSAYAVATGNWLSFAKAGNQTQDQIARLLPAPFNPVPEPSTLALGLLAAAGIGAGWLRRGRPPVAPVAR
jgi:hypothetical protein